MNENDDSITCETLLTLGCAAWLVVIGFAVVVISKIVEVLA